MTSLTVAPTLSLIVPIYNEEATIDELRARLLPVLEPLGTFEVILINDGSTDRSAPFICAPCTRIAPFISASSTACGVRALSASGEGARESGWPLWQDAHRAVKSRSPPDVCACAATVPSAAHARMAATNFIR